MAPGPIALVGSGEYLPVMLNVESALIEGRAPKYVQIPTAAAPEGAASLAHWVELGRKQAERMNVEHAPVLIRDHDEANKPEVAELIKGAGLIYLSGGNPTFLSNTLRNSLAWEEIVSAWRDGAALAGCSAGAMAIADYIPTLRLPTHTETRGLGLLSHIRVLPHFDRMFSHVPDFFARFLQVPEGVHVLGIDEDTAVIGGPTEWTVQGEKSAWLFVDGHRVEYPPGTSFATPVRV